MIGPSIRHTLAPAPVTATRRSPEVRPPMQLTDQGTLVLEPEWRVDKTIYSIPSQVEKNAETERPGRLVRKTLGRLKSALLKAPSRVKEKLGMKGLSAFERDLAQINKLEKGTKSLVSPAHFQAATADFKTRLAAGESLDALRDEAYAVAREAIRNVSGMRAYDCQVLGALAMNDGYVAEMRTGEGKTLTALLPLYLNALEGKGAQLVTVNETLAKRDADFAQPIFELLGMSVACVNEGMSPGAKRQAYNSDVTYISDRALGFDYLQDRQAIDPKKRVQRDPFFVLIDEVDEVLIDEARTPMILSAPGKEAGPLPRFFGKIVDGLEPGEDFQINKERTQAFLTEGGLRVVENEIALSLLQNRLQSLEQDSSEKNQIEDKIQRHKSYGDSLRAENRLHFENEKTETSELKGQLEAIGVEREKARERLLIPDLHQKENAPHLFYLTAALKARSLFYRDVHYTVEDGDVKIVDANKGRVSEGKRFSEGIHQALEAKEGLQAKAESRTLSQVTLQELFSRYPRKAGMSGTAASSKDVFRDVYNLSVVEVPTNKPIARVDGVDAIFASRDDKNQALVKRAITEAAQGRPVLIGTPSVESNKEILSTLIDAGWPEDKLQVINAERLKNNSVVTDDNTGRSGAITLRTTPVKVEFETINYAAASKAVGELSREKETLTVEIEKPEERENLELWLEHQGLSSVQFLSPSQAETKGISPDLRLQDFAVIPLLLKTSEKAGETLIEEALLAQSQGRPVLLDLQGLGELQSFSKELLDLGQSFDSLPMICPSNEKENVLITSAGRSGVITVATNMAGRGANIKPDRVRFEALATDALEAAKERRVLIEVSDERDAGRLESMLGPHVEVQWVESSEELAESSARICLVKAQEKTTVQRPVQVLSDSNYSTGGLLVLGSERSFSRRVDDQLIGRAGRQGAQGESLFYCSTEDQLTKHLEPGELDSLRALFGQSSESLSGKLFASYFEKAQDRAESGLSNGILDSARKNVVRQDQNHHWYSLRDEILKDEDRAMEALAGLVTGGAERVMTDREKFSPEDRSKAESLLLGLGLETDGKAGDFDGPELSQKLLDYLRSSSVTPKQLQEVLLRRMDLAWSENLDEMKEVDRGLHWEQLRGREAKDEYPFRAFQVFYATMANLEVSLFTQTLPAIAQVSHEE